MEQKWGAFCKFLGDYILLWVKWPLLKNSNGLQHSTEWKRSNGVQIATIVEMGAKRIMAYLNGENIVNNCK